MSAQQDAKNLRREAWNSSDNRVKFPVDPFAIADRLGIDVLQRTLPEDTAGFIRKAEEGQVQAYLNNRDGMQRQRFTLAHELGHFYEHRGAGALSFVESRNDLSSSGMDRHEVYANNFAAELLMPASILRKWWAEGQSPEQMREKLNVSRPAFAHRLKNLGLI